MNKRSKSLDEYFVTLRSVDPKSFDSTRKIVDASALLQKHSSVLSALRLDFSLLAKRYLDLALIPILSAGFSIAILLGSGGTFGEKTTLIKTVPYPAQPVNSLPIQEKH